MLACQSIAFAFSCDHVLHYLMDECRILSAECAIKPPNSLLIAKSFCMVEIV